MKEKLESPSYGGRARALGSLWGGTSGAGGKTTPPISNEVHCVRFDTVPRVVSYPANLVRPIRSLFEGPSSLAECTEIYLSNLG